MKRTVSLVLVALLTLSLFCFTGCGAVNEGEVSILWSGNGKVENPNSLINAMERAMYIKNVEYKHYGANGNWETQVEQAKAALSLGCQVLVVELAGENGAQAIIDAAKEKDVPVVFFNCWLSKSIVESYDKCYLISSDKDSIADVQGKMIADYIKANFDEMDKNEDNKISYNLTYTTGIIYSSAAIEKASELLAMKGENNDPDYRVKRGLFGEKFNLSLNLAEGDITDAEMILTESDEIAVVVLKALQEKGYNTNELTTKCVPIFTIGESVDYKELLLAGRPAIPAELQIKEGDSKSIIDLKNKAIKQLLTELQEYYADNQYLVDLTVVNESDLAEMVYTTVNVIDAGRIAGTATEDRDTIAMAVASVVRNLAKGNAATDGVASKVKEGEAASVTVDGQIIEVRYIAYAN